MPSREQLVLCAIYVDSGCAFHVLQGQLLDSLGLLSGGQSSWNGLGAVLEVNVSSLSKSAESG